jgi:hypothetical protein
MDYRWHRGGYCASKDVNPGSNASNPNNLTEVNGKLYFLASDGSGEARLWESDGTTEGTK